jgi:predicted transcriptional regulator
MMRQHRAHHLVVDHGSEVGVLTESDIFWRGMRESDGLLNDQLRVEDLMVVVPTTIKADASLEKVLDAMRAFHVTAMPITLDGVVVGIVTMSDILGVLAKVDATQEAPVLADAAARGKVIMSHPLMQNAMQILSEAGI